MDDIKRMAEDRKKGIGMKNSENTSQQPCTSTDAEIIEYI